MYKPAVLVFVVVMAVCLTGCGLKKENKSPQSVPSAEESNEAEAAQATAEAKQSESTEPELVLKYGEVNPEDNITAQVAYQFAKYVDELSGGRIQVDVYPGASLGGEKTSLNALNKGNGLVDIYRANTNSLTGYNFKKLTLFGLPYIFKDREGLWKVLTADDVGKAFLSEGMENGSNMVGLFYTDEGPRNMLMKEKVRRLTDIKGKKIRVPESVLMMDTLSALGAQPIPMPYEELYDALESGYVEGAENPLTAYLSNRFYEVAPYYLVTEHVYSPGVVMMAEDKWNELSEEDRNILKEAGRMASEWNREAIGPEEERLRNELVEKGIKVVELTPKEKAEAREAEEIVRKSFSPGLEKWVNEINEIQK
ncbi:TRAP transporter substrate-binding protein [Clostridium sp. E02]|uniref:TRAP transporter substrate-binding protein n=1 Tax=Clostridium sp. E02 TaxID=2487134 RepID=UPI0013DDB400|nr:TRAP transporter substrate-binding protein [Clostridium sp. E02]